MCGIVGFVGNITGEDLSLMLSAISHRGPDNSGIFQNQNVGMGNARLAIIGRRNGHQPLASADGTLVITYNGEIYNHINLRKTLEKRGHRFTTKTDTEVVLSAYQEYGEKCLEKLEGMFAFAIWDDKKKQLFAARDRFGIKPFFYTKIDSALLFSSEIKGLLTVPSVKTQLNFPLLLLYLKLRYVPEPQTLFSNIYHLPTGHYLIYDKYGNVYIKKYWDISSVNQRKTTLNNSLKNLHTKLSLVIKGQLMSEIPVGVFVSGGVDSGLLAALSAKYKRNIQLFSVSFPGKIFDESNNASIVAKKLGLPLHQISFSPDWVKELPRIVWHLDQPLADPAVVPTFFLSQYAKKHVGVVLSGDGADETLAGYDRYKKFLFLQILLPFFIRRQNAIMHYFNLISVFSKHELSSLLSPTFKKETDPEPQLNLDAPPSDRNILRQILEFDLKTWLPGDILLKTDRMTMAHALEARVPFLDHNLVEFIFSLPTEFKLKYLFQDKWIERKLAEKILPKFIARRPKHGFDVPLEPFSELSNKILSEKTVKRRGWFRYPTVKNIMDNSLFSRRSAKQTLSLLVLEVWAQIFLDNKTPDQIIYSVH